MRNVIIDSHTMRGICVIECYELCLNAICDVIEQLKSKRPKPNELRHATQLGNTHALIGNCYGGKGTQLHVASTSFF